MAAPEPLTAITMEDNDGNTFLADVDEALRFVEAAFQAWMEEHPDTIPPKAGKIAVVIEVEPTGIYSRTVTWAAEPKVPRPGEKRAMAATSQNGLLVTSHAPGRQRRLELHGPAE